MVINIIISIHETYYACQSFQYPMEKKRHAIAFEAVISPELNKYVHHMILFTCGKKDKTWEYFQVYTFFCPIIFYPKS